jgi:transposase-like protein
MRRTSDGKQRRTRAEWAVIISQLRESNLSIRDFARREKLSAASLQRWSRQFATEQGEFIELTPRQTPSPAWQAELLLPGGVTLRLHG